MAGLSPPSPRRQGASWSARGSLGASSRPPGGAHRRDEITGLIWNESSIEGGRGGYRDG